MRRALTILGAGVVLLAVSERLFGDDSAPPYSPDDVAAALTTQGLPVHKVPPPGGSTAARQGSFLLPADGSFTVLVTTFEAVAAAGFEPYESDTDPSTFEVRERNVIVLADFSNSETPLNNQTRTKILKALARLRENEN